MFTRAIRDSSAAFLKAEFIEAATGYGLEDEARKWLQDFDAKYYDDKTLKNTDLIIEERT